MTAVITQRLEVRFASNAGLTWFWLSVIASGMLFLFYQDRFIRTGLSVQIGFRTKQ
jgi:hypothetical protein